MLLMHHQVHMVHTGLDVVPCDEFIILCMCLSFQLHQLIEIPVPAQNKKRGEKKQTNIRMIIQGTKVYRLQEVFKL